MNVGEKCIKYIPAIFMTAMAIVFLFMTTSAFSTLLSEHEQQVVAIALMFLVVLWLANRIGHHLDHARDRIDEVQAREDGLTMKRPGLGYLRSAHREVHS